MDSSFGTRTRQDLQDLDRALLFQQPNGQTPAEESWGKFWTDEEGNVTPLSIGRGVVDIGVSAATTPIRGIENIATGNWEHPLETIASIGSIIPIGRGAASLVGAGLRGSAKAAIKKVFTKALVDLPNNPTSPTV